MSEQVFDEFDEIVQAPAKPAARKTKVAVPDKVTIIIHKDTRDHAVDPVPVALNGVQYTIRRGMEVEVPAVLIEVLDQAEEIRYESVRNQDGSTTMVPRKALSYPYQIIRKG